MKTTIPTKDLQVLLGKVSGVIPTKASLPILTNVLLTASSGGLTAVATNLETGISACAAAGKAEDAGKVCVDGRLLSEIVRELPSGEEATLASDKRHAMQLKCGNAEFKINGVAPDDFPKVGKAVKAILAVKQSELRRLLSLSAFAVSVDAGRAALCGVLFETDGQKLRCVGTDGRRLAVAETDCAVDGKHQIIIPAQCANELIKLLGNDDNVVGIEFGSDNSASFEIGTFVSLYTKGIAAAYPDYTTVIPQSITARVTTQRTALISAIRRASVLTSALSQSVGFEFVKNKLLITAQSPDKGEVADEISTEHGVEKFATAFNAAYLLDALQASEQEFVTWCLQEPEKPVQIVIADRHTYVVMPMQRGA